MRCGFQPVRDVPILESESKQWTSAIFEQHFACIFPCSYEDWTTFSTMAPELREAPRIIVFRHGLFELAIFWLYPKTGKVSFWSRN
jgi:hypothetical protein